MQIAGIALSLQVIIEIVLPAGTFTHIGGVGVRVEMVD
jgi:hypothetical protein